MERMVEISRQFENKEYSYRSYSRDSAETEFLRRRERDRLEIFFLKVRLTRKMEGCASQEKEHIEQIVKGNMRDDKNFHCNETLQSSSA
jgi:hypothetical protein